MRLFASTTPRGLGRSERCTSARPTSQCHHNQLEHPPSPLTQRLTKQKPASTTLKKSSRRSKNAVHPIDLRDLESELEFLRDPSHTLPVPVAAAATCSAPLDTRPFTASIAVLHALDLHNPCQIRSCPHAFLPHVQLSVDGATSTGFDAARHAKNHSSWFKKSRITHRVKNDTSVRLHLLRVSVSVRCTRHPHAPTLVSIGHTDDIPLPLGPMGVTISQFYPIFRYHSVQNRMIKYFAGKIKLTISITLDPPSMPPIRVVETEPVNANCESSPAPPEQPIAACDAPPVRPAFLSVNLGDALQLKRKQLKATVVPVVTNHALSKPQDDPIKAQQLMDHLHTHARHHLIRLSDVQVLEAIGEGVHASVFRARIDGIDVAMKEFRYEASTTRSLPPLAVLQAFQQEYEMLARVSSLDASSSRDDQPIQLVGVIMAPRLAIFTDYCSDGSLAQCLANHELWPHVSMETKLVLANQLARGLAHLHSLHIVHRDIKTHNIMIQGLKGQHPIAKIGDLGSAVIMLPTDAMLREETGSSGYTAPEVFGSGGYDHSADIWSLGIVLWELLLAGNSQKLLNPFTGACGDEVADKAERNERPEIPSDRLPSSSETLLRSCWELNPSGRPTAAEIAVEFATILSEKAGQHP